MSDIGWELLDDNKILHIWNKRDSYYFEVDTGIQLSNHYEEYWTHNIMMIGYYDGDAWNLIYRNDELSGFNHSIDTDDSTYIDITLWKNLTYQGYDFRLAIKYHLGVNDQDLTVSPYIKNLGIDIPYELAFGWEMKDIQIAGTQEGDRIKINGTRYFLNQPLDNKYDDLSSPIYDDLRNIIGWSDAVFYLEQINDPEPAQYLYLKWDKDLNYLVTVKSRANQYNAPVTLFIRIGTLNAGQEKSTELHWYDAEGEYIDSWSLTGANVEPFGITTDGTNIWVVDEGVGIGWAAVYKYNMAGGYIDSWRLIGANTFPYGITTDGTNIWVVDVTTAAVYKYSMAGDYIDSWSLTAANTTPRGITTDGANIWVVDTDDVVYKYNMAGDYIDSWGLTGANDNPFGIATDGTNIWVVDYTDGDVYKYIGSGTGTGSALPPTGLSSKPAAKGGIGRPHGGRLGVGGGASFGG